MSRLQLGDRVPELLAGAHHTDLAAHDLGEPAPALGRVGAVLRSLSARRHLEAQPPHVLAQPADVAVEVLDDAVREHQAFEERVGGQPVGAVDARARHLPTRVQAGDRRAAPDVGEHAPDEVMAYGGDRDEVVGEIKAVLGEAGAHGREARREHARVEMRRVEVDEVGVVATHLGDHAAHDDVARRELGALVVARHEAVAALVAQVGALAAQRLGDEEHRLLALEREPGRMELHELEVADGGAGPVGHGDAVAGGHRRVRRAAVHLAGAARREDRHHRHVEGELAVVGAERQGADAAAVHRQQVDDELVLVELHAAADAGRLGQGARDLAAGGVAAGVQHARDRVRALPAQHDLAVDAVEVGAHLEELAHPVRALVHEHLDGLLVAEAGAGAHRVLEVQLGRVGLAEGGGDAALGEEGGGVVEAALGEQADPPATGGRDGGRQAGDAAAQHEHVEGPPVQGLPLETRDVGTGHWPRPTRPCV